MTTSQDYKLQVTDYRLLKKVARSFYLTIYWLPSELREPVALAYLLARASDTIADKKDFLWNESEQKLVKQLPLFIKKFNDPCRPRFERKAIKCVLEKILEGQNLDLRHQRDQKIFSADELEEYLYLVAGCVGEFLTQLIHEVDPNFSRISLETMNAWAINYGKGLQLVNILRDFSRDQEQGKFYFTEKEKNYYHTQANLYLQQGEAYVKALRPGRFKMACALPLLLGVETLTLLKNPPNAERLKIRRWRVYATVLKSLRFLIS